MRTENMFDPRRGYKEDAILFLLGRVLGIDCVCRVPAAEWTVRLRIFRYKNAARNSVIEELGLN
jgi:hypothetical protein